MNGQQAVDWSYRDQTLRECLKSSWRFGETAYFNLCNGQQQVVPWGGLDWLLAVTFLSLGAIIILGFVAGAVFSD